MTWTATATGGSPPLQYRFILYDQTANAWSELRNYGVENSVVWTPLHSGTYWLQVWVRAPGSTAIFDAWAPSEEVTVVAPPVPTMVALRSDKPLPPAVGTPITWTADAAGDGLDYKFLLYRSATNSWTTMQDYGPSASWTWAGPSQADIYAISVWVRRHGSLADYETWSGTGYFTVASGPVQNLTLTTNQTFPLAPGSPIRWTASASGGTAPLEYQFWLYDRHTSTWTIKQPWSSSATWTWTPTATDYGVHAMQVWVRSQGSAAAFEAYLGSGFFVIIP